MWRVVAYIGALVLLLLVHLGVRIEHDRRTKDVRRINERIHQIEGANAALSLEAARLRAPTRLSAVAESMELVEPDGVVHLAEDTVQ